MQDRASQLNPGQPAPLRRGRVRRDDARSTLYAPAEREGAGMDQWQQVVVGLDNGGTANNATVLDADGQFLVDEMVETPSRVREGPAVAVEALAESFEQILDVTGTAREAVLGIGLDTPGPASADGVISFRGAINFADAGWRGIRHPRRRRDPDRPAGGVQQRRQRGRRCTPITRTSAPAPASARRCPLIVGTGLGGGVVGGRPGGARRGRAWPASWATSASRWTACWPTGSRCPPATAAWPATRRASPRCRGSSATCSRTG